MILWQKIFQAKWLFCFGNGQNDHDWMINDWKIMIFPREYTYLYLCRKSKTAPNEVKHLSILNLVPCYWKRHIWHSISVLQKRKKKKRKKTEMFDKLVSRQKQNRDGGGRCWWQVYYATEATGEANNWEMELSQHFAKCATPKGVTLSLVKTRWNNSLRRLASVTQDMPVLSMWHTI